MNSARPAGKSANERASRRASGRSAELEGGEAVEAVEGQREGGDRDEDAREDRGQTGPRARVEEHGVQREEGGARGGEVTEVGPVAVVRDDEIPGGVPARG